MGNGIIFLVVSALVLVVMFFSYKVVRNIQAQKRIDQLYATEERNKAFIKRVLVAAFGHRKVILNAKVPVKGRRTPAPPATADALIITRAGVIVITILPRTGALKNDLNGEWRYKSANGKVTAIENPFARNSYMIEVLKNILRKDGFHNISFHSLVVISNSAAVSPQTVYRNMFTENTFLDEIRSIMLDHQLSFTETRDVATLLRRNVIRPQRAQQFQNTATDTDIKQ